jgi:hypothetical protein
LVISAATIEEGLLDDPPLELLHDGKDFRFVVQVLKEQGDEHLVERLTRLLHRFLDLNVLLIAVFEDVVLKIDEATTNSDYTSRPLHLWLSDIRTNKVSLIDLNQWYE